MHSESDFIDFFIFIFVVGSSCHMYVKPLNQKTKDFTVLVSKCSWEKTKTLTSSYITFVLLLNASHTSNILSFSLPKMPLVLH